MAVLTGQPIDPAWTRRYTAAAVLMRQDAQPDGSTALRVTQTELSLFGWDTQQTIAARPDRYVLTEDAAQQVAARRPQALANTGRHTWKEQQSAILQEFPQVG